MDDNTNLFILTESSINAIKKPDQLQKILALKGNRGFRHIQLLQPNFKAK